MDCAIICCAKFCPGSPVKFDCRSSLSKTVGSAHARADGRFRAAFQTFATIDDFEAQLDRLLRGWLEDKVRRGRTALWPIEVKGSPFCGLAAFGAKDAPVFFGRSHDITRAVDEWKDAAARGMPFLLLLGASGAGKSSLARAGLVPRITATGVVPSVDLW